jgi:hypothetical protein
VLAASIVGGLATASMATTLTNPWVTKSNGGWTLRAHIIHSTHWVASSHSPPERLSGRSGASGEVTAFPSGQGEEREIETGVPPRKVKLTVVKERMWVKMKTPLVDEVEKEALDAQGLGTTGSPGVTFWHTFLDMGANWTDVVIHGQNAGTIEAKVGNKVAVPSTKQDVHVVSGVPAAPSPVPSSPPPGLQPIVREFGEGGLMGEVWDEDEEVWTGPVLIQPDTVIARFTSACEYLAANEVRYTYTLENLSDADRSFAFSDVTAPGLSGGWSGEVSANTTATLAFTTTDDLPYLQRSIGRLCLDDGGGLYGGVNSDTVEMYVPGSRMAFSGTVQTTSATYSEPRKVTVSFTVQSAQASTAVLYRVIDAGTWQFVAETSGTFTPGIENTIVDEDPISGVQSYVVMAGNGVNGRRSPETATVTVP